jgi:hypothetical protein
MLSSRPQSSTVQQFNSSTVQQSNSSTALALSLSSTMADTSTIGQGKVCIWTGFSQGNTTMLPSLHKRPSSFHHKHFQQQQRPLHMHGAHCGTPNAPSRHDHSTNLRATSIACRYRALCAAEPERTQWPSSLYSWQARRVSEEVRLRSKVSAKPFLSADSSTTTLISLGSRQAC